MKSSAFMLTICMLLSCQEKTSLVVSSVDKALVQQGKVMKYKGVLFSGKVEERFDNGELKHQSEYVMGLEEGKSSAWYANGSIESIRNYRSGEKDGVHHGWWPNGTMQFEYHFENGVYNGTFKEWYSNGKPMHHFIYNQGKEESAVGWRENGRTYINFVVKNGRKYGLTNARLCFSLVDEKGVLQAK